MIIGDSLIVLLCASVAWATSVSDTCAAKGSDGVLLPAVNCNQYYMCSQGAPLMLNCQADLVFNIAGYCDWPNNVNCDDRSVPEVEEAQSAEAAEKPDNETPATPEEVQTPSDAAQICAAEGSDGVLVPAENCAQFYKCSEGLPVVLDCPAGLLYNPGGWCDWPKNVNCADRSVPDVEEEAKSEEAAEKPDETPAASEEVQAPVDAAKACAAEGSDGVLVPAENCAQFYKCSEGLPVVLDCPAGLLYNPGGWCDWPKNVNCADRSVPDVEEEAKSEEAAEKPDETPAASEEVQAPVDAAKACAAEGSDGLLVPAENCAQFYKCSGGLPVILDCQAGLLYNPSGWCDWPQNVNCADRSVPDVEEEAKSEEAAEKPDETPAASEEVQAPVDAAKACAAEGSDGVLVPAENCAQFYKCSEGLPVVLDCPAGLLYNPGGWCDWPQNVNCADRSVPDVEEEAKSEEAAEKPDETPAASEEVQAPVDAAKACAAEGSDGVLVPAENCAQFYKCSEGLPVVLDCPAGLLYNPGGWCDWPKNVNCADRSVPDVEEEAKSEEAAEKPDETPAASEEVQAPVDAAKACAAEGSDGVLVPAENCAQFYKCSEGLPVVLDCPAGLLYNPGGWCDWPQNVNCADRSVPDVEEEAKSEEAAEKPDETPAASEEVQAPVDAAKTCAADASDGLLVPAENCAQFYKCSEGLPVVLDCPAGLLYNPGGWCDWPQNVNCADRSVPDVEEEAKSEEAAEKPDESPAASEEVQAPADAAKTCAAEGSDGLLVPAENCAQFYKCSEGLPVIFDCQAGLLYNPGGWCDWPENVNCGTRAYVQ